MINTHLVLVSILVYTSYVSNTTVEDKDVVSMRIRGHGTLVEGRDAGFIAGQIGVRMCDDTRRYTNPTFHGGIS